MSFKTNKYYDIDNTQPTARDRGKTAMQELIEWMDKNKTHCTYGTIRGKATELLTTERQQIIDARISVTGLNHASPTDDNNLKDAEDYYNSKYKS